MHIKHNNIVITETSSGQPKVIFTSAKSQKEAREMSEKEGDRFITFIPVKSSIMLESCVMDEGSRMVIEAFLTNIFAIGVQHGALEMKKSITNTVTSFMEARFKKAGA